MENPVRIPCIPLFCYFWGDVCDPNFQILSSWKFLQTSWSFSYFNFRIFGVELSGTMDWFLERAKLPRMGFSVMFTPSWFYTSFFWADFGKGFFMKVVDNVLFYNVCKFGNFSRSFGFWKELDLRNQSSVSANCFEPVFKLLEMVFTERFRNCVLHEKCFLRSFLWHIQIWEFSEFIYYDFKPDFVNSAKPSDFARFQRFSIFYMKTLEFRHGVFWWFKVHVPSFQMRYFVPWLEVGPGENEIERSKLDEQVGWSLLRKPN